MRPLRALRLSVLVLCLGGVAAAASAAAAGPPREPFFPSAGNPGIDVLHYAASFSFKPTTGTIRADTVVTIAATRRLPRFSLDLDGLRVTAVEVDQESARFSRGRGKLWIRPPAAIAAGERFHVTVFYRGRPRAVVDPDGTKEGWLRTDDGAVALGEPEGTAAWLPCDNVPADKATFDITVVVPRALVAVSNGRLRGQESLGPRRRFSWHEEKPMSTYLALVTSAAAGSPGARSPAFPPGPWSTRGWRSARERLSPSCRRSSASRAGSTGTTRSRPPARWSTTFPTSATRWRTRRGPSIPMSPT
jgi:peptidase M1-like protein